VVRRELDGIRRYCHLGTGNYHHKTARAYTDYGLLTANEAIGLDVHEIFMQLTSLTRTPKLRLLLQSPFTLHERLLEMIREQAARGARGRIAARMNALTEPQVIEALYEASRAGTRIDLVVRGTCALRPGIAGMSENITVRSIIGRFLEHPRLWCFGEGRKTRIFLTSADWMERNLFHRVEIAFPVLDAALLASLRTDLQLYLEDRADAWVLQPDGTYRHAAPPEDGTAPVSAQASLLKRYTT
jgi:polyphosphate kinase